jgi:hypothetical protein
MPTLARTHRAAAAAAGARAHPHRRDALRRIVAAAAAAGFAGLEARAAAPLSATLTAKKVAGHKVRTTVHAKVSLPGLVWSGVLGTWDVPEAGRREVTTQPPGVPARFRCALTQMQDMMHMMLLMQVMMVSAVTQDHQVAASAPVSS